MCVLTFTTYAGCRHMYKNTKPCASINLCLALDRGATELNETEPSYCHSCFIREHDLPDPIPWQGRPALNGADDNHGLGDPLPGKKDRTYSLRPSERFPRGQKKQVRFEKLVECKVIKGREHGKSTWFHPEDILSGDSISNPGTNLTMKLNERASTLRGLKDKNRELRKAKKLLAKPLEAATSQGVVQPVSDAFELLSRQLASFQQPLDRANRAHHELMAAAWAEAKRPQALGQDQPAVYVPPPLTSSFNLQECIGERVRAIKDDFERYTTSLIGYRNAVFNSTLRPSTPHDAPKQSPAITPSPCGPPTSERMPSGADVTGMMAPDWDQESSEPGWEEPHVGPFAKRPQTASSAVEDNLSRKSQQESPSRPASPESFVIQNLRK